MSKMEKLVKEINKFSKLAKKRQLTKEETAQRELVRNEYRKLFKQGFEQRLQGVKYKD